MASIKPSSKRQLLQQAEVVASRMPQAPDPSLVDTDPFEYQRRKLIYDTEKAKLDDIVVRRDAFMRQTQQQQYQTTQRQLLHEREATLRALPDLRDPVKAAVCGGRQTLVLNSATRRQNSRKCETTADEIDQPGA
jgi:hypothetical protein